MTQIPPEAHQPEDHKRAKDEPFVWTAPDGRTVTFKPFGKLPSGMFRKARHMDEMGQTFALLEAGTDEAGLEVLDELPLEDMDSVFEQWAEAAGVELPGESLRSSESSTSTAEPSSTTGEPVSESASTTSQTEWAGAKPGV